MKAHQKRYFAAVILSIGLSACSLTGDVREDPKATGVSFKAPKSSQWQAMADKADADSAWIHKKTGATLALRSLCRRYEHLSLRALSQNLINTLQENEVQTQTEMQVAGRAALSTHFKGQIDGVAIENRLVVMRKDHCIFDFTLSQLAAISPEVSEDFDAFLSSFSYEGGTAP